MRFLACSLRGGGTALVNQTPAAPVFGPAGFHPQAARPPWAGALRLRSCPIAARPCGERLKTADFAPTSYSRSTIQVSLLGVIVNYL